jgi:hypothetical protein
MMIHILKSSRFAFSVLYDYVGMPAHGMGCTSHYLRMILDTITSRME